MFKFDFYSASAEDGGEPVALATATTKSVRVEDDDLSARHLARKIEPEDYCCVDGAAAASEVVDARAVAWRSGDVTLVRVVPSANACPAAPEESDLVPGVYEGGLKVWEASLDLVQHLFASGIGTARQRQADDEGGNYRDAQAPLGEVGGGEVGGGGGREGCGDASSSSCSGGGGSRGGDGSACSNLPGRERLFDAVEGGGERQGVGAPASTGRRRRVLELGCGHGFPGIMALRQGWRVCFSDFNREVLDKVTIPNVRLNVEERSWPLADYYSGDWASLSPLLDERDEGGQFDLILTAETLYTTAVADKVLDMVLKHLAPGGQALVASKRFYFGTGGSTQYFRDLIAAEGRLICTDAVVIDTGKGNIREVLRVSWREEATGR